MTSRAKRPNEFEEETVKTNEEKRTKIRKSTKDFTTSIQARFSGVNSKRSKLSFFHGLYK